MEKIDVNKVNKWLTICLAAVILIIMPLVPEIRSIGKYSLKTTIFNVTTIFIALVFICFNAIFSYNKRVKITKYEWILLVYVICVCLSTIMSEYRLSDLFFGTNGRGEGLLTILCYVITFIIIERNFSYSKTFFDIMTIAVILASGWGIIQTIIPEYINVSFVNKDMISANMAISNMINPNFFSSYLLIFLPIYIVKYLEEKDAKFLPIIAIIFTAFICAKTMGGYVTFIVTMIIISIVLVINSKEKRELLRRLGLLILTLTISFILINEVNDNAYVGELSTFNTEIEQLQNKSNSFGSYRGVAWKMAIRIIKDYPVFGIGPDSFGTRTIANQRYYWSECLKLGCYFDKAHCEYLQIAATTGIPSLICYISFISLIAVGMIKKYVKALKEKKEFTIYMIVGSSIFAYLMQAGANISITCIAPIFWIMLGVAANLCNNSIDK